MAAKTAEVAAKLWELFKAQCENMKPILHKLLEGMGKAGEQLKPLFGKCFDAIKNAKCPTELIPPDMEQPDMIFVGVCTFIAFSMIIFT